jgi:DNA-binding CsgD family transcriptional regulator/tetratricopeptide (TPR) repeat protein
MSSPVLVGREAEVGLLEAAVAAAGQGQPSHFVIGGEAGVGKTRLLAALRERAESMGVRSLLGGCVSMGDTGLPYAPFTEIVRGLIARDGAPQVSAIAGRASADLSRLVPALGADVAPPSQEIWAQARMYEALLDLLRRYAKRSPLVVQLEDLHWADAGTLAATAFLLRAIVDEPIVVMATYREDEVVRTHPLRPWLAEAARIERVERLGLGPFDEPEVAELTAHITGHRPTLDLAAELARRSDGNPFFIEELLCGGAESGQALPQTLREVLLARVDTLSEAARQLLGVAAVGGRDVRHDLLVAVGGEVAAVGTLREVVDAGLLVPSSDPRGDVYSFRHALLQEAVHDALLPNERRRLHGAFGQALHATLEPGSVDATALVELAHHWREARDGRALEASIIAGRAALAGFSFDIATSQFEHALELWEDGPTGSEPMVERVELLDLLARAAYLASRLRRAETATRAAIEILGEAGDRERRTILTVRLARILWVAGQHRASLDAYEEAFRLAPPRPSEARIRALSGLGQAYMLLGRYARAVGLCDEAARLARSHGYRELEGHALNSLGTALAGTGRVDEGLAAIDAALAIALELGLPDDIGRAQVNRGDILDYGGHPGAALASTRQGLESITALGIEASYGAFLRLNGVRFAFDSGAWTEAAELLAQADRNAPEGPGTTVYRALYAMGFLVATGAAEARASWDGARRIYRESPPAADAAVPYAAAVELASMDGRFEEAIAVSREALDFIASADPSRYGADLARRAAWPASELGLLAGRAGDAEGLTAAHVELDRLIGVVESARHAMGDPGGALGRILRLDREQILAERGRMEGTGQVGPWRDLVEGWLDVGFPYLALYARWREAEAAELAGDRPGAAAIVRMARDAALELGARPLAAQMEGLARRMRLRFGATGASAGVSVAGGPAPAYGLTPREREVLALVAAGRTNRQVADELFISESTAGVHVSNIMGKLGVSTRTEAASVALTQGLVKG